ncbi:TIGR04104 family putative zinc finger protein [Thalassobacillus pellis]|uniref:TIGR04104 family putative zinc finger protein n=1 Tax=Thalassobacillus pellis TaxID=748008 RepID=UPI0019601427|nr:TIGR04104 family putative zinc finger protein [Thalassobacillus pellis]MBM7553486.1 CXXC-20-CXXC protein [Thalassobacillus pellis]
MPVCDSCKQEWSWKETMSGSLMWKSKAKCPYCGEEQYMTAKSKRQSSMMSLIPVVPMSITIQFGLSVFLYLPMVIVLGLLAGSLAPRYIKLASYEEPLW